MLCPNSKMENIIQFLQRIFQGSSNQDQQASTDKTNGLGSVDHRDLAADQESIISLMQLLELSKEGEYTCAETLDLLDEYVELAVNNQDVAAIMPLVKNHIGDCPDCTERYEALVQILQSS